MKIRTSQYTRSLLLGLVITVVIRYFYNPLQLSTETYTFWDIRSGEITEMDLEEIYIMSVGTPVRFFFQLVCPVISTTFEICRYVSGVMMNQESALMLAAQIMVIGYVIFTLFLERFHSYWHAEEGRFTICIDILCLENIASYVLSLVFYFMRKALESCNVSENMLTVLWYLLMLPCAWLLTGYFIYLASEMVISLAVPGIVSYFISDKMPDCIVMVILGFLVIVFSQIVWRLCSDIIFNKLLEVFSFKNLSLK